MKKCFIYARVGSSTVYNPNFSITGQKKILQKFAKENNIKVVDEFTEIGSASSPNRKTFMEMLQRLSKREADGILCVSLDRLSRNFATSLFLIELMKKKKIEIITPELNCNNSSESKLLMHISASIAEYQSQLHSQRIKRGILAKRMKKSFVKQTL